MLAARSSLRIAVILHPCRSRSVALETGMESNMFPQAYEIRRRQNATIDIDFYRQMGLTEHRAVMSAFFAGLGKAAKPLVGIALIAVAIYAAPPRNGAGRTAPSAA